MQRICLPSLTPSRNLGSREHRPLCRVQMMRRFRWYSPGGDSERNSPRLFTWRRIKIDSNVAGGDASDDGWNRDESSRFQPSSEELGPGKQHGSVNARSVVKNGQRILDLITLHRVTDVICWRFATRGLLTMIFVAILWCPFPADETNSTSYSVGFHLLFMYNYSHHIMYNKWLIHK